MKDKNKVISFEQIGLIETPFKEKTGMPIQAKGATGVQGKIILHEELTPGLADLDEFSHLILLYHFNQSTGYNLKTKPFLDDQEKGVFAIRAPRRPNAIGLSVVKLNKIEKNILYIENVDMLDQTPLLDIKPYVRDFDIFAEAKCGWYEKKMPNLEEKRSDDRYAKLD